ncbi:glycoside hydrolase family 16 protein [Actinocorallia longicatena]|uniref:GH16 domain-containing protein n=1 Tax=Actinocorallia longicatena TaxID=111803 RepID=A0ABP6QKX6_9ACTN
MTARTSWGARAQVAVAVVAGGLLAAGTAVHVMGGDDPSGSTRKDGRPVAAVDTAVDPGSVQPARGPKIVWSDEFDGGGAVDEGRWSSMTGDRGGWGVGGLAYYDPANVVQDGSGTLNITASRNTRAQKCWYGPCQYRSGRIQTAGRFSLKYGTFAARIKFPTGKGVFPAFWLQSEHADYGTGRYAEIDIAEVFGAHPRDVLGAAHQTKKLIDTRKTLDEPLDSGFHTYAVKWTPTAIRWFLDGKPFGELKRYKGWSFDQPMQIIMNLQIGGDWQGPPNARTRFPAVMAVDWVRIYENPTEPR